VTKNEFLEEHINEYKNFKPNEGELFGMLCDRNEFFSFEPDIHIPPAEDNPEDSLGIQYDYLCQNDIAKNVLTDFDFIPLILRKLDGTKAQEMLTGIIFRIGNEVDDMLDYYSDGDIESFQEHYESIKESPVFLSNARTRLFPVDDHFKVIYADNMRGNKEEVVSKLEKLLEASKENFEKKMAEGILLAQAIAETENMIHDFARKGPRR